MRISDLSSDVCSSDLPISCPAPPDNPDHPIPDRPGACGQGQPAAALVHQAASAPRVLAKAFRCRAGANGLEAILRHRPHQAHPACRTEEHTSELQSLMRTSYAALCLKKKLTKTSTT